jgi:DNA repair protein RecN (Recombination protein N)
VLLELAIRDLGVIEHASLVLGPGMTAVTGETGAGKTMIVGAIDLLVGGRSHADLVRPGATEAVVEGRFLRGDEEVVVRRVVPREGRSRAYIDGRLAAVGELAELGAVLVDLHGQHAHQSLLRQGAQRDCLDRFGRVDLAGRRAAVDALRAVEASLAAMGGDERSRAREIDLLRFQVGELHDAGLTSPDEDDALETEEDVLSDAVAHQEAAALALELLGGDDAAADRLGAAVHTLDGRAPFAAVAVRLRSLVDELTDLVRDLRAAGEAVEDDPERLAEIRARRQLLRELRRKYGDTLADVIAFRGEAEQRLAELEQHDARAAALDRRRAECLAALAEAEAAVRAARRAAAPALASAIEAHLADLAMPKARFAVDVDGPAGDDVTMRIAPNPGGPPLPLARTASGGELARTMLAIRLVLTESPPTLVFDEVDAGIGGTAANAVGAALAQLGADHQVLVVTHLAQVAAAADHHVVVAKDDSGDATVTRVAQLDEEGRVVELSRMLSGTPDSAAARGHAEELLAASGRSGRRGRASGKAARSATGENARSASGKNARSASGKNARSTPSSAVR